jgi:phospholipase C
MVHIANAETNTSTRISNVVIIMQENHSFDNYFGTYPTANGTLHDNITQSLQSVNGIPSGICLPYLSGCVTPYHENEYNTTPPIEGQITYENDYDGGKMDGFSTYSGPQSMTYFDYRQLAAYWNYAEEYGLGENYFASLLTTTTPNRMMLFAGDTPVANNYGPPPFIGYDQTLLKQLSDNNVTWGYFDWRNFSVYPFIYISGLDQSATNSVHNVSQFFQDLSDRTLPSVSFVMSLASNGLDEHPPSNVTQGELWTVSVVNAIMRSSYWNSSAIFIVWDEGGGYYDHVIPPQVLSVDHSFDQPVHGLGQRVPLLVISPYAKENYVSETILNHMSLIRFIEYNWQLPTLNHNVASSNNLLDFFDFNATPRPPIILGTQGYSNSTYPIPIQIPFAQLHYNRTGSMGTQLADLQGPYIWSAMIVGISLAITFARYRKTPASH